MLNTPSIKIYLAPIQESTDHIYRSAYAKFFGGVDKYFAPYMVRQNDGSVKPSHLRDVKLANNLLYPFVPQILAGNSSDFIFLTKLLEERGCYEINWNLGCPYPMVTNKGLGSGLLSYPEKMRMILEEALPKIQAKISIKMRAGLFSSDEVFPVIDVLNDFPLHEIILHPRIAKQLYRGTPDTELFAEVLKRLKHELVYNGDIVTNEDYCRLNDLFSDTKTWMIGRGILKNPFLPLLLKNGALPEIVHRDEVLRNFHQEIFLNYTGLLKGPGHLLSKMEKFWSYFCFSFPDPHKTFKRIKKASNVNKYETAVNENFQRLKSHPEDIF